MAVSPQQGSDRVTVGFEAVSLRGFEAANDMRHKVTGAKVHGAESWAGKMQAVTLMMQAVRRGRYRRK